jgi:hypothetical protein
MLIGAWPGMTVSHGKLSIFQSMDIVFHPSCVSLCLGAWAFLSMSESTKNAIDII